MMPDALEALAARVRALDLPPGAELLKTSRVRRVVRSGDVFLKLFIRPRRRPAHEARALVRAAAAGLAVPELLGSGVDWIATRFIEGRPAARVDLPQILRVAERMHGGGLLHGDFHLGNLLVCNGEIVVTDWQRARRLRRVPRLLRERELGYLAFSLGEPLPAELEHVRRWRERRARRHWTSRGRRCLTESGSFTRFTHEGLRGFRRRERDPEELARLLLAQETAELIKNGPRGRIWRAHGWVVKEYASRRRARRAWHAGNALEARGIATGTPQAWVGRRVVMEDAGGTLIDWVEREFGRAEESERHALADLLGSLLATLHRRGTYHADLKANNIAWSPGRPPRLLDFERVRFLRRVPLRRRVKNLAQLNAALPDLVPGAWRERALGRYLEESGYRGDAQRLRARVIEVSLRRRHRWHGC